jgi:hypothetical protein
MFAVADTTTCTRGPSVTDGLSYAATWNAAVVLCHNVQDAMMANMGKRRLEFKN